MRSLVRTRVVESATTVAGKALAGLFFVIGKVRTSSARALHPRGELRRAVLARHGCEWPTGVPWLDGAGTEEVLLRFSRSVGLPERLPDVLGLAVRVSLERGRPWRPAAGHHRRWPVGSFSPPAGSPSRSVLQQPVSVPIFRRSAAAGGMPARRRRLPLRVRLCTSGGTVVFLRSAERPAGDRTRPRHLDRF